MFAKYLRSVGPSRAMAMRAIVLVISTVAASILVMGSVSRQNSISFVTRWTAHNINVNGNGPPPPGCEALASTVPENYTCQDFKDINEAYTLNRRLSDGEQAVVADVVNNGTHYIARFPKPDTPDSGSTTTIKYGRLLCGLPHISQLVDVACHKGLSFRDYIASQKGEEMKHGKEGDTNIVTVFEKCGSTDLTAHFNKTSGCFSNFTYSDVKAIVRQLHTALLGIHLRGIAHKDIGTNNIMYDRDTQKLCLIDFGLAKMLPQWLVQKPTKKPTSSIEKAKLDMFGYKETIYPWAKHLSVRHADDIIAMGAVVAKLLALPKPWTSTGEFSFERSFNNGNNKEKKGYFLEMMEMLGSEDLLQLEKKYEWFVLPEKMTKLTIPSIPKKRTKNWKKRYSNECNKELLTDEALSFVSGLLQYSYAARRKFFLNAQNHPFISV